MQQIPSLKGDALGAVKYRGGHLQIIASAGSGKTEVVSQRVAGLLVDGLSPASIVAFTFTERAAASLKSRIEKRAAAKFGNAVLDTLNGMFVGTIHSYCFRVLQQHVPKYETFDVLDDHRLMAFLTRQYKRLGVEALDGRMFRSIAAFRKSLEVIENELLRPNQLEDPLRDIYERYLGDLEDHRFLTYGQIISRTVEALGDTRIEAAIHDPLQHLIVDEYQDINPAQEALIERLALPPVHLCVVGDDDQSIYQWRGSDVNNIIDFQIRYPNVQQFHIERNRRSRPGIIQAANQFAQSIHGRLSKRMREDRPSSGGTEVVCWTAETEPDEARVIARAVRSAHDDHGYRYRDIAILCRGRIAFPAILDALAGQGTPVQPGGRTNLFLQPDADLFGRTICWLMDHDWRFGRYGWDVEKVSLKDLTDGYTKEFALAPSQARRVRKHLEAWKLAVEGTDKGPANLVREFYELLNAAGVDQWDLSDPWTANRLGTLARCSQVLADYETARRRARPDHQSPGDMRGGQDRGRWYYVWLSIFIQNWARGAYEDFEGEEDIELDAVDLTTIHQAKGLEWPIVFVPSLKVGRFPSSKRTDQWHVPRRLFSPERYEGSMNDERRLFYVAMTRARDFLSLSTFERQKNQATPSPFLVETAGQNVGRLSKLPGPPPPETAVGEQGILEVTFSDLAAYLECGLSYRLRRQIGFQPPLAPEIGYGKAVHHVLRRVAEHVQARKRKPTPKELDRLFDDEFYMPAANKAAYREMKQRARKLVDRYLADWESELHRVWAVERPFELHLGDATISGRADVIFDEAEEGRPRLTIVDYKTGADSHDSHGFQLQVYTNAGRREGLRVEDAYVHDLKNATRQAVDVDVKEIEGAEARARSLVLGLRSKAYVPKPGKVCAHCDVRQLCPYRV